MTADKLKALGERATKRPWKASSDEPGDVVLYSPADDWLANVGNWARQHPELDAEACARQCAEMQDGNDALMLTAAANHLDAFVELLELANQIRMACQCHLTAPCFSCRLRAAIAAVEAVK